MIRLASFLLSHRDRSDTLCSDSSIDHCVSIEYSVYPRACSMIEAAGGPNSFNINVVIDEYGRNDDDAVAV